MIPRASTTPTISMNTIRNEFGQGTLFNNIGINLFYRGGLYVPNDVFYHNNQIPASGTINLGSFRGTTVGGIKITTTSGTTTYLFSDGGRQILDRVRYRISGNGAGGRVRNATTSVYLGGGGASYIVGDLLGIDALINTYGAGNVRLQFIIQGADAASAGSVQSSNFTAVQTGGSIGRIQVFTGGVWQNWAEIAAPGGKTGFFSSALSYGPGVGGSGAYISTNLGSRVVVNQNGGTGNSIRTSANPVSLQSGGSSGWQLQGSPFFPGQAYGQGGGAGRNNALNSPTAGFPAGQFATNGAPGFVSVEY